MQYEITEIRIRNSEMKRQTQEIIRNKAEII
jgi:hypothetical protein